MTEINDDELIELLTLTVETDIHGNTCYFDNDGKLHRIHGPAVIYASGAQEWFVHGERHRDDGPAVTWANGATFWYQNDEYHRIGGPAVMMPDGHCEFWIDGIFQS